MRSTLRSIGQPGAGWLRSTLAVRSGAALVALATVLAACGSEVPTIRPSGSSPSPSGGALGASTEPPNPLPACKGTAMRAAISGWGGTKSTRIASVVVSNKSGEACSLRGTPGVRLLDAKGRILLDSAKIEGIGGPKVRGGDPVVALGPDDAIAIDVQWTNWCKAQPVRPLTVGLVLTDRGGLLKASRAKASGDDDTPSCTGQTVGSEIRVTHTWQGPGL